jgi:hypothetical protein
MFLILSLNDSLQASFLQTVYTHTLLFCTIVPSTIIEHQFLVMSDYNICLYHADVPPENETSGYIFIHAEGGLNQQRIAVCMLFYFSQASSPYFVSVVEC